MTRAARRNITDRLLGSAADASWLEPEFAAKPRKNHKTLTMAGCYHMSILQFVVCPLIDYCHPAMGLLPLKPHSHSGKEVKGWPTEARTVARSYLTVFLNISGDLLVCGLWICVLVYGGTIWRYNGTRLTEIPFDVKQLIEAGRYVSLLFPRSVFPDARANLV
jgi:hypothetical protein